jgi:hypothetical protein
METKETQKEENKEEKKKNIFSIHKWFFLRKSFYIKTKPNKVEVIKEKFKIYKKIIIPTKNGKKSRK